MLISPTEDVGWSVAIDDLRDWLVERWPDVLALPGEGAQRAHGWRWPDNCEVWVPEDCEVAWVDADPERTAAIAAHLAASGPPNLVLADESYELLIELSELAEEQIADMLRAG